MSQGKGMWGAEKFGEQNMDPHLKSFLHSHRGEQRDSFGWQSRNTMFGLQEAPVCGKGEEVEEQETKKKDRKEVEEGDNWQEEFEKYKLEQEKQKRIWGWKKRRIIERRRIKEREERKEEEVANLTRHHLAASANQNCALGTAVYAQAIQRHSSATRACSCGKWNWD